MHTLVTTPHQVTPGQRPVMTLVEVLVLVRQLSGPGPALADGRVRIEEAVRGGVPQRDPRQCLANGGGVVPVVAVAPGMHQVSATCEDGAVLIAAMILAEEVCPFDVVAPQPVAELAGIDAGFPGRDPDPVVLRVGDPVGDLHGHSRRFQIAGFHHESRECREEASRRTGHSGNCQTSLFREMTKRNMRSL